MTIRARRFTLGTAVAGMVILGVLVVLNWGTVRDHAEAWHFQLTRETVTMDPGDVIVQGHEGRSFLLVLLGGVLEGLDVQTGDQVIYEPREVIRWPGGNRAQNPAEAMRLLRENGFRMIEQRFPRTAYVLIRDN